MTKPLHVNMRVRHVHYGPGAVAREPEPTLLGQPPAMAWVRFDRPQDRGVERKVCIAHLTRENDDPVAQAAERFGGNVVPLRGRARALAVVDGGAA